MSNYTTPGLKRVRESRAYKRMKEANPDDFEPKTIFFATYPDAAKSVDWQNCLPLKAAFVYHAITHHYVDVGGEGKAQVLLIDIAEQCKSLIKKAQQESKIKSDGASSSQKAEARFPATSATAKVVRVSPDESPQLQSTSQPEAQPKTPSEGTSQLQLQEEGEGGKPDQTSLSDEDCALVDGIFLVVGFLSGLKDSKREEVDSYYLTMHSEEIAKDIIKIENQLPLELIKNIVNHVETAINKFPEGKKDGRGYKLSFNKDPFPVILSRFCWYYSPVHYDPSPKALGNEVLQKENLLQCLHFSLTGFKNKGGPSGGVWRSPSARQLKRCGVRFAASAEGTLDVEFQKPNLKMPALAYDFKLETVVRNLLAWECLPEEKLKPVARYLQFMSGLVGDLGDVRVLKKFGLIKGRWKNFQEILDLVKRIDGSAFYPAVYVALDKEANEIWQYHDTRMKSFLVRNRPAVLWFSSVAAASVIVTAIYASRRRREE